MQYLYLAHHGIKGQKWYNRRYQNTDGSLTPLGRAHYGVGAARKATANAVKTAASKSGEAIGKAGNAIRKKIRPTSQELDEQIKRQKEQIEYNNRRKELARMKKTGVVSSTTEFDGKKAKGTHKHFSEMSDQEINDRINRLRKETELAQLESLKNMGPIERMVLDSLSKGLSVGAQEVAKSAMTRLGRAALDEILGPEPGKNKGKNENNSKKKSNDDSDTKESDAVRRKREADETLAALKAESDLRDYRRDNPSGARKFSKAAGNALGSAAKAARKTASSTFADLSEDRAASVAADAERKRHRKLSRKSSTRDIRADVGKKSYSSVMYRDKYGIKYSDKKKSR